MNSKLYHIFILVAVLSFCACSGKTVFSEYQPLPREGWHADSALCFGFAAPDTISPYDVIISIRHTQQYPYQNMWLFISGNRTAVTGHLSSRDTIEFFLADDRGRWLGNGYGNLREMPVLYMHNHIFRSTDTLSLCIEQAMRENTLRGISDVGVKIVKSE